MKVGRPRLPASKLSKWGSWKRGQRELPSKPSHVRDHIRAGSFAPPTQRNTQLMTRAAHAAKHNRLRRKRVKRA